MTPEQFSIISSDLNWILVLLGGCYVSLLVIIIRGEK